MAEKLRQISLDLYSCGRDFAKERGIIFIDTKFEFGLIGNDIILIDEVLTPDSSRYWPAGDVVSGQSPPSFDKQIVRDHLEQSDWDKQLLYRNCLNLLFLKRHHDIKRF